MERTKEERPLGKSRHRWMYNIKRDLTEITSEGVERIHVAQDTDKCRTPTNKVINFSVRKMRKISWPTEEQLSSQEASWSTALGLLVYIKVQEQGTIETRATITQYNNIVKYRFFESPELLCLVLPYGSTKHNSSGYTSTGEYRHNLIRHTSMLPQHQSVT